LTVHIVTKILVVFGAILSVLLSALTIAYAANADMIRGALQSEQNQRLAAQADLNAARSLHGNQVAALQAAKEAAEQKTAELDRNIKDLQNQRASLLAEVEKARFGDQSLKNQVDSLTAQAQSNAAIIKAVTDEVSKLRSEQVQSARRETELVDRLNDLESQRQVLEQNTRALQEQLAEARLAVEQAKSGVTASSGAAAPFVSTGPLVSARVLKILPSPTGEELAEISEGSNAGIKPNMKMAIVRGRDFVANFVVTKVDLQRAVGRIEKLGRSVDVKSDDLVLSRVD
jgi:predicted  nucleic acid-binding Zn-ribbon protein